MPFGFHGNILHVNLTTGTLEIETPPEMFYRKYMGGSAMGMVYILRETPRGADALSPEQCCSVGELRRYGEPSEQVQRYDRTVQRHPYRFKIMHVLFKQ